MNDTPQRSLWKALTTPTGLRAPGHVEPPPTQYGPPRYWHALGYGGAAAVLAVAAYYGTDTAKGDAWWVSLPGTVPLVSGCILSGWWACKGRIREKSVEPPPKRGVWQCFSRAAGCVVLLFAAWIWGTADFASADPSGAFGPVLAAITVYFAVYAGHRAWSHAPHLSTGARDQLRRLRAPRSGSL